jgi:polar amino acid transport system substrate-binding protein
MPAPITRWIIAATVALAPLWAEAKSAPDASAATVQLLTEHMPPYSYREDGQPQGVLVDIVRHLCLMTQQPDNIQVLPWSRAYQALRSDKNIGVFPTARTPEREDLFQWVGPLITDDLYFYRQRNSPLVINSLDDARQVKSILAGRNYVSTSLLRQKNFTNLETVNTPTQAVKMLAAGRGDLTAISHIPLRYVLKNNNIPANALVRTDVLLSHIELYLAFSQDTPAAVVQQWRDALREFKASQHYRELITATL